MEKKQDSRRGLLTFCLLLFICFNTGYGTSPLMDLWLIFSTLIVLTKKGCESSTVCTRQAKAIHTEKMKVAQMKSLDYIFFVYEKYPILTFLIKKRIFFLNKRMYQDAFKISS